MVKNLPAIAGNVRDSGSIPGSGEKEMATHSSILAWEIPQTEEAGLQSKTLSKWIFKTLSTFDPAQIDKN